MLWQGAAGTPGASGSGGETSAMRNYLDLLATVLETGTPKSDRTGTMMLGGSLPGRTRVASIAIYDEVQSLHYDQANAYALTLLAVAFGILVGLYWFTKKAAPRD